MILLGWEIGSGKRVEIPETGHLAWFGQTQLSGKTTALEAIAFRGELRAVAFITKQGEGGFLTGRMIPPYFSEPTNDEEQPLWRWVKSILEASQQRKMNFEESWIIRACEDPRRAETLADVHKNIRDLLGGEFTTVMKGKGKRAKPIQKTVRRPVTGMNAGVYTSLKAYFDIVMPQLARLPYSKKLVLGPGLNVMDLRGYAMETQALVIRSVMESIYQHEKNVRVIVPEAQDFIPQGRNSPVKMACETLVRKAGANRNFVWLDSQDMAAVDKFALRACSVVGIGVQTEMHEIDRALASTFTPTLRALDIARLKIGEFFVRTPEARVSKVYVQPAWMESELHAQAIAKGEESVASARQMLKAFKRAMPEPPQLLQLQIQEPPDVEENEARNRGERRVGVDRDGRQDVPDIRHPSGDREGISGPLEAQGTGLRDGILSDGSLRLAPSHSGRAAHDGVDEESDRAPFEQGTEENQNSLKEPPDVEIEASPAQTSSEHADGDQEAHRTPGTVPATGHESGATDPRAVVGHDSPQSQIESEPGKHENETKSTRDFGFPGSRGFSEVVREEVSIDAPVRGASSPSGPSENQTGSEGAMPKEQPKKEPAFVTVVRDALQDGQFRRNMPMLDAPLRDLLMDHAAVVQAHDALAARVEELIGRMLPDELYEDRLRRGEIASVHPSQSSGQAPSQSSGQAESVPSGNGHGLRFTVPDLEYIWKYVKAQWGKDPDRPAVYDLNFIYDEVKHRATKDPGVLEILTRRPELRVKVERTPVTMDDSNLQGRIARLLHEGFFKTPRNGPAVQKELKRRTGIEQPTTNLYKPLNKLTEMGFLTVEQDGYQEVAEMKVFVTSSDERSERPRQGALSR